MEQKGISLEPEQVPTAGTDPATGIDQQIPSITEQNLNNTSEVTPVENVDLNAEPGIMEKPSPEPSAETQQTPTTDLTGELN